MDWIREIVSVVRSLLRRPVFAGLSIALLVFGIGAVTAMFAVVDAAVLRPLPYTNPGALFAVAGTEPVTRDSITLSPLAALQLVRWRRDTRAFSAVEGYTPTTVKLTGRGAAESLPGAVVSAGLFQLLGSRPLLGRTFSASEEALGAGVVVISHGLWIRRFGADPGIVGRIIDVDDVPQAIVGVMPASFSLLLQPADVFVPLALGAEQLAAVRIRMIAAIGRLKPGMTIRQATSDLAGINAQLGREYPQEFRYSGANVVPLRDSVFGSRRAGVLVLFAAVVLLLAVASVNALSLTFADMLSRTSSTMTRMALGANRYQIARMRILESAVLVTVAGVLGVIGGRLGLVALRTAVPDAFDGLGPIPLGLAAVVVAAVMSAVAGLVSGLPVAMSEAGLSVASLAGTAAKSVGGVAERRMRDGLLGLQVAMAVMLLVGASLLVRNLRSLLSRPTGMRPTGVVVVEMTISRFTYPTMQARAAYVARLLDAIRALPGVAAASSIQTRFVLNETMQTAFDVDGRPADPGVQQVANIRHVTPSLPEALGLRLRRGRAISASDRADGPPVAMVSESFARQYLGGVDAIGKRIRRVTPGAPWMEVVGIVDNVADAGAGVDIGPTFYVSYYQQNTPLARVTLLARASGNAAALFPAIRRAVTAVDPNQSIDGLSALDDLMIRSAAQPRFQALVGGLFALSALFLVVAGIYAVTLYGVLRRTRELGLRAALGAGPTELIRFSMWQSMRPIFGGLVLGLALALPAGGLMQRMLSEHLGADDIPIIVTVTLIVVGATAAAAYLPARRALLISPTVAMRD